MSHDVFTSLLMKKRLMSAWALKGSILLVNVIYLIELLTIY